MREKLTPLEGVRRDEECRVGIVWWQSYGRMTVAWSPLWRSL